MMKTWLVFVILAAVLAGIGVVFALDLVDDYFVFVRARMSMLLLLFSLVLAVVGVGVMLYNRMVRDRIQSELDEASRRQGIEHRQFLFRLDHELKNPLTALQVELANLDYSMDDIDKQKSIVNARMQAQRMGDLVSQLRKLAELETQPITLAPVSLAGLLEEIVLEYQDQEKEKTNPRKIALVMHNVPWELSDVPGDEDLLYLAAHNVIGNAVKFTQPGDLIQVRALEDGQTVLIEVADTGPGIPEGELAYVWDELYRGKDARGLPGSGLGLPLVRAIIARHGGEAQIRSRVGKGTVVILRLPLQTVTSSLHVEKDSVTGGY